MAPPNVSLGFALYSDQFGSIKKVIFSSHQQIFRSGATSLLQDLVDEGSLDKVNRFYNTIQHEQRAIGWEVVINLLGMQQALLLFGYADHQSILVIGAPDNFQANLIRQHLLEEEISPSLIEQIGAPIDLPSDIYTKEQSIDDISQLNNEIIILQRELFKNQSQLEQMNATIKQYSLNLEEMVAERTRELQISESKFRGIFEASSLGITILSSTGIVLTANRALQEIIGCSEKEICQQNMASLLFDEQINEFECLFFDLKGRPSQSRRLEKEFVRADGSTRWVELIFFLIQPGTDQDELVINMVEDITQKKISQQALVQAEKLAAVGKIAASLAHEINNPLQAVMGNLGLVQETLQNNPDLDKYLQVASSELKRVSRIVSDLREASRKPVVKEKSPAAIDAIVQKVVDLTRKKCEEKSIVLTWKKERNTPMVLVSADQIEQVVLNLVINAIEAMPDGGELSITSQSSHDPAGVSVLIADNGIGLSDEVKSHLFEPFFSTKQEGMGLGLYISQQIMKNHHGKLEIDGSYAKGTTLRIWLPAAEQ